MNLMCFVWTKSTFKVPIPEIHTQIITNPLATKNPIVETNRKPRGKSWKTLPKLHLFFRRWRMDVWPSIVKSNWIPWRPPPSIARVFGNCKFPNETLWILGLRLKSWEKIPKRTSEMREVTSYFFKLQMIIVYDLYWSLKTYQCL